MGGRGGRGGARCVARSTVENVQVLWSSDCVCVSVCLSVSVCARVLCVHHVFTACGYDMIQIFY